MSDNGCGAPVGGVALADVDAKGQAVIQGVVRRGGVPLSGAYARLLDASGDFVGEVATGEEGTFRFFAADGAWKVRVLASKGFTAEYDIPAVVGTVIALPVDA
ncbi:DUF1416 domain-containing protein [Streptomonospora sp. S1-112]|uniref:DUF1416 domain-containing protein n=1 Tax=Streptomonospora mangrovi TaxID=2883123 RepID=A0A9X3NKF6_9ACTN|nr:DUF1416 domain-containing protein [Streptomonospora mangrovi]MDA0563701.1 DUF1416 domain-containing protein [Streptomonospora mangrovi]